MTLKKIALVSAIATLGIAQGVSAHTGIKDKGFYEGIGNTGISISNGVVGNSSAAYSAFTISHGCASNAIPEGTVGAAHKDVIAMAALFPNSTNNADVKIYRYKTGSVVKGAVGIDGTVLTGQATTLPVVSPNDLTDDINGAVTGAGFSNMSLGLVSPNLFGTAILPKLDAASTLRGYAVYSSAVTRAGYATVAALPLSEGLISTTGLSPFKFAVPTFNSNSCAANLIVRVAVSNWCSNNKTATDRKDVWIGTDTGSVKYSMAGPNHEIMPNSRATMGMTNSTLSQQGNGASYWPSFTVTRDLTKNPLPAACKGESYDVVVQPSGADIDKNLSIKQAPYPNGVPGVTYW